MALFGIGGDRPLFGGSQAPGAQPPTASPAAPTSTALMAQQTGATASSPFLQYLQQNAPAARQTAAALMGEAPEPDYRSALIQAGMGILSQPGGQSPLQAIAKGAQTAMPLFLQEQERVKNYDEKVSELAAKLNMSAAEFDSKVSDEDPFKEMGGNIVDTRKLKKLVAQGVDPEDAFEQSIMLPKKYEAEQTSEALARAEQEYERLKGRPDLTPEQREQLDFLQTKISGLRAQIFPEKDSKTGFVPVVTSDGRMAMVAADSDDLAGIIKQFGSQKEMEKIKTKQQAAADAAGFTGRLMELTADAPVSSMGRIGGLASDAAAWSDLLLDKMQGPVQKQFSTEVKGRPLQRLEEMYQDPEARAWLDDGLYEKLVGIGKRDAQILSNILGLGYATAKASDEGGRLSDSDVALNLRRLGYDLDAWLNDPTRVRAGLMETLRNNVSQYRTQLEFTAANSEEAEKLLQNDILLNRVLPRMGFGWEGGVDGELVYRPQRSAGATGESRQQPRQVEETPPPLPESLQMPGAQPGPVTTPQPVDSVNGQPVYDGTQLTPEAAQTLPSGTLIRVPDGKGGTKLKRIP